MKWRATAAGISMAVLAACGVDAKTLDAGSTVSTAPPPTSPATTAPATTGSTDSTESTEPATTEAPTTVEAVTTTIPQTETGPNGGRLFVDPTGLYQLSVRPSWEHREGSVEFWFVAAVQGGFRPNLNVLTQQVGLQTAAQYLASSVAGIEAQAEGHIVQSREITLLHGDPGGLVEYTAMISGRRLHFLAVVMITRGSAVLATLTAPEARFALIRREVEPFMRTLQPAP